MIKKSNFLSVFMGLMVMALIIALPDTAEAQRLNCKASKPELDLKTYTQQTKYIRTKSSNDLTEMHGRKASSSHVGGLGGGEIGFKSASSFEITHDGTNACVNLKELEVSFFAKPEIHIASNFSRTSCEYNAVMGHEKQHIRIMLKFLREYSPNIKQEIKRIANRIKTHKGPIPKNQVEAAQNEIQQAFLKELQAYYDRLMPILVKRQNAFDNPKEYKRVSDMCKDWDKKLGQNHNR